jgi:L-ascorbate metabolism protein UlaG (beta-lactamase superfamily)
MHLTWLGQTCVKLQTKPLNEEVVIIIDPYKPTKGEFPRSFSPHIALFSKGQDETTTLSGEPFIIDTLGEFDIKNNIVTTWGGTDGSIIFKVNSESLNVAHIGPMSKPLSEETIEALGKVDILLISVGGNKKYLEPAAAAQMVTSIEPRIVIPIGYECDTDPTAEPLSAFIKEIGLKPETTDKKLIIKPKDLPQEDMKLFILEKT